jgi:hypothetical protein
LAAIRCCAPTADGDGSPTTAGSNQRWADERSVDDSASTDSQLAVAWAAAAVCSPAVSQSDAAVLPLVC